MLGQRRAVDRNEGFPAPATVLVNELGNDLLAGATLPLMNTEASVGATLRARSTAFRNSGEIPIRATESLWLVWSSTCWRSSLASRFIMTACEASRSVPGG